MENSHKISKRPFFENLTGLRFVGAIAVFIFHCFSLRREIWGDFTQNFWFQKVYFLTSKGHLGIILFFVLSGFLITYLLLWETEKNGKINLWNYLMRRFLRVWPMYFLIVLFGFFVFPYLPYGIETIHEFWRFALFLSNFDEILLGMNDSINFLSATWTVSVEEQFYLVWGILIGLLSFNKKSTYLIFFIAIILSSLIFRYNHLDDDRMLYFHTFSVFSDLAFGGIIGLLAFSGSVKNYFENLTRLQIILYYLGAFLLFLFESHIFHGVMFTFERFVPGIIFSFIILEQIYSKNSIIKVDRIPYFFQSGELTYGFYMFHCIFIYYWSIFFENHGFTEHLWQFIIYMIIVFASTYTAAYFSLHYFERPFLRLKKYFR